MLKRRLLETLFAFSIVTGLTFPASGIGIIGGQYTLPDCNVVQITNVTCSTIAPPCTSGMLDICDGCGTGRKDGLCVYAENNIHPCGGSIPNCYSMVNSKKETFGNQGQICVPQDCP